MFYVHAAPQEELVVVTSGTITTLDERSRAHSPTAPGIGVGAPHTHEADRLEQVGVVVDLAEATIAPRGVPGVLHDPVVGSIVKPDDEESMSHTLRRRGRHIDLAAE